MRVVRLDAKANKRKIADMASLCGVAIAEPRCLGGTSCRGEGSSGPQPWIRPSSGS